MKYKTIGLYYGNGESNLIHQMSHLGWGLMNKMDPNYEIGQREAFYTFVGGDDAKEIEDVDFRGDVTIKIERGAGDDYPVIEEYHKLKDK